MPTWHAFLCTNGGEKDLMPFTNVVEQCKIYKFGIQLLAHFGLKIWRKGHSNRAKRNLNGADRAHVRDAARCAPTRAAVPLNTHAEAGFGPLVHASWAALANRHPGPLLGRHAPRAHRRRRADHAARPTTRRRTQRTSCPHAASVPRPLWLSCAPRRRRPL
jgi:hypothetical protein